MLQREGSSSDNGPTRCSGKMRERRILENEYVGIELKEMLDLIVLDLRANNMKGLRKLRRILEIFF